MNDTSILQTGASRSNDEAGKNVIAVFARPPVSGRVKTRLIGASTSIANRVLNASDVAQLYEAMLCDTLRFAQNVADEMLDCEVILMLDCATTEEAERTASRLHWHDNIWRQGEGDLGEKLLRCFTLCRRCGYGKTVIIGSDSPDLPGEYLTSAFQSLNAQQFVLGPAYDGGFYLIGAAGDLSKQLFDSIEWSTQRVLEQALSNAARCSLSIPLLDSWRDVDDEDDLRALITRLGNNESHALKTAGVLTSLGLIEG